MGPSPLYNHFLLTEAQRECIGVVLVSPRNPLNIGAAARAMANFGLRRLAVVAPYAEHWREAKSAVGAPRLLQDARETETLAQAVADCTLVVGTGSLAKRKPEQRVVMLPELAPLITREIERGGRAAVVFGSEKRGLTREDLAQCHLIAVIPTDERQPSMNLGQAVAVFLYEIAVRRNETGAARGSVASHPSRENKGAASVYPLGSDGRDAQAATSGDLELLGTVVEETIIAANYSPAAVLKANRRDLRLLLHRLALSRKDAGRILGLFRRILWRLKHSANRAGGKPPSVTHK